MNPDRTRRGMIKAGGAVLLSNALAGAATAFAQTAPARVDAAEEVAMDNTPISPVTIALADYVAKTLDRELPQAVLAKTKLHVLDTVAAIVSGSRLKPGRLAASYVETLG